MVFFVIRIFISIIKHGLILLDNVIRLNITKHDVISIKEEANEEIIGNFQKSKHQNVCLYVGHKKTKENILMKRINDQLINKKRNKKYH